MNNDHFLRIGSSHKVCEDYCTSGKLADNFYYSILSDGCSSSDNTDLGSRFLVLETKKFLNDIFSDYNVNENDDYISNLLSDNLFFQNNILRGCLSNVMKYRLNSDCLDCTLLLVIVFNDKIYLHVFGDGCVAYKKNGKYEAINISYTNSAPFYLNYEKNKNALQNYHDVLGNSDQIREYFQISEDGSEVFREKMKFHHSERLSEIIDTDDIEHISIMSDGICSFMNDEDDMICIPNRIRNFCSFKNFNGQFVHRRLNKLQKEDEKNSIDHYDDISISTIYIGNGSKC